MADEGFGGFFADAWDAGEVVGGVAPEGEDIDDLGGMGDLPLGADFGDADDFVIAALAAWFPDEGTGVDELGEVLVGGDHEGGEA